MMNNYEMYNELTYQKFWLSSQFWSFDMDSPFYFKLDFDELFFVTKFLCFMKNRFMGGVELCVVLFYTDLETLLHLTSDSKRFD